MDPQHLGRKSCTESDSCRVHGHATLLLEAHQHLLRISSCKKKASLLLKLRKVSHGTFQTSTINIISTSGKNTTCLLDCHHTGISHPQRSTLLPTISADRHFGKCVHQFLEETRPQSRGKGVRERQKEGKQKPMGLKRVLSRWLGPKIIWN